MVLDCKKNNGAKNIAPVTRVVETPIVLTYYKMGLLSVIKKYSNVRLSTHVGLFSGMPS